MCLCVKEIHVSVQVCVFVCERDTCECAGVCMCAYVCEREMHVSVQMCVRVCL